MSSDPYIFKTDTLPSDERYLPPLANGLLGWRVFGDKMYMGGVYNGEAGECHRADLPCPLAARLKLEEPGRHCYSLDTHTGKLAHSLLPYCTCFVSLLASLGCGCSVCLCWTCACVHCPVWMLYTLSCQITSCSLLPRILSHFTELLYVILCHAM